MSKKKVYIYQAGKVGSSSIQKFLEPLVVSSKIDEVYHVHLLSPDNIHQRMNELEANGLSRKEQQYGAWISLGESIKVGDPRQNYFITLFRDPVERAISAIFQNLNFFNKDRLLIDNSHIFHLDRLQDIFLREWNNPRSNLFSWYQYDFVPFMGVTINHLGYDKTIGYGLSNVRLGKLLLIQFEKMEDKVLRKHLEKLLEIDLESEILVRKNISSEKSYSKAYKQAGMLKLPLEILEQIYMQDYVQYMYSLEMVDMFKKKWKLQEEETVIAKPIEVEYE